MADRTNSFEELEAWKSARELARFIYSVFRREPASHDFGLKDQVQRAAVLAMTNVAEGFERLPSAEKLQFYSAAHASCGEVRSLSYVMLDAGYVSDAEHGKLLELVGQTGRLISSLIHSARPRTASHTPRLPPPISQ